MKRFGFLIALILISSNAQAEAWEKVQKSGCLTLMVALEDSDLLRPDIIVYLTGLWDGILADGRFGEQAFERAYWKICKTDPGRLIPEVLPLAARAAIEEQRLITKEKGNRLLPPAASETD